MKLAKIVGLGALSLSLATLPMINSVSAQDASTSGNTTTTTTATESDRDFDWGWLGLLGLAGLAGLAAKKRDDNTARYQDPNVATTTSSRSDYR
jgi:hypothetical protein